MIVLLWFIYHCWMLIQGTTLALTFLRDLRNLTVIYKPNAYVYHLCQTSHQINFKRIRWHYQSLSDPFNDTDTHCKHLFNNSDCFDFYYGVSTSVLVIKEPDMYNGKYTCHVTMNSTYEITSSGYIDVKLPPTDIHDDDEESMGMFNERELGKLAESYHVPFILDENDLTSFGKRIQIGGTFQTRCQSIPSIYPIDFTWILLKNTSDSLASERVKTIQFIQSDHRRIKIEETKFSSSLTIHPVELADDGDYVCIATNIRGRSFSSTRSLIVSERMIFPRIRNNLLNHSRFDLQRDGINELVCVADAYPEAEVVWLRASDLKLLSQNSSRTTLKFDHEMHGVNTYICEAKNKHGLTRIFITVLIPDNQSRPILSYSDIQSRSVLLSWRVSNGGYDRFNHFIIYYRRLHNSDENPSDRNQPIHLDDYKQVLVDPRTNQYSLTFRMMDLCPYAKYEFMLKGFIGATPSAYSNSIVVRTAESVPEKIENLHGYVWNETSIAVHWTPPNATNGPNFHYVLYYTTNTSTPFNQWSHITVRTYPFHILRMPSQPSHLLFIRVASVNAKGSTLSDFHIINRTLIEKHFISSIEQFQCSFDDTRQEITLQWLIESESRFYINRYILYYLDLNEKNDDLLRQVSISLHQCTVRQQQSSDLYRFHLNRTALDLNSHSNHLLRLHLAIIDHHQNQLSMTSAGIYCRLTRNFGE